MSCQYTFRRICGYDIIFVGDTMNTRYYSNRQERYIAKSLGGKKQSNSGATSFQKGDVKTDLFLIEAKTQVTEKKTFILRREWFSKIREEAFSMGKPFSAVSVDFGDGVQHYIIDEKLFIKLNDFLKGEQ